MRDSLLSRFRGAFLGVLLGEVVGMAAFSGQASRLVWQLFQGRFNKIDSAIHPDQGIKLMLAQASALTGSSGHPVESDVVQTNIQTSIQAESDSDSIPAIKNPAPSELILSTLPLALFYHDQPGLYRTVLQTVLQPVGQAAASELVNTSIAVAMVLGQAISLILRERFVRLELIPQILKDLDLEDTAPDLANQLHQIQDWVERSTDLAGVARHVKQRAAGSTVADSTSSMVALALYGFLCTPDNFHLSLLRASQLHPSLLLPTLTGAISGVYNGVTGLPSAWRQQVWLSEAELAQRWGIASAAKVEELADRLLACWSGAADPLLWLQQPQSNRITAAPRAIRPD